MIRDDTRLRVALVVPPYYQVPPAAYGGVESVVADLADGLVADGHSVIIVGAGEPKTKAHFVRYWDRLVPERIGEPWPEMMNVLLTRRAIGKLVGSIDVVHDHSTSGPLNAETYARWGLPTVVTMHSTAGKADNREYYATLGKSISMVAISHRQRVLAPEFNWVGTVHNALRVEQFPFRAQKKDYALFLGRFAYDKGTHTALDVAHKAGLPLVMAAKCVEPSEKEFFAKEVVPRLTPQDVLFGEADAQEKRILLANARCLLFPVQWEEPFGMVMIEAMACGTPVVALRRGAVPEVIADGVTGIICDEPDQLVDALDAVSGIDPATCRAHVASKFNIAQLAHGYAAAYRRAIAAMPRVRPTEHRMPAHARPLVT